MKAAVYYNVDDVRIKEMPTPNIGPQEIMVEMKACGVCGSDLMHWYLKNRVPLVLGHEPAGIIVEAGDEVKNFNPGERVFVHHHVPCLTCHYCLQGDYTMCNKFAQSHIHPGGFAEYFRVPAPNLQIDTIKIPHKISFEEATLIEPVSCCIRALKKSNLNGGDSVVIIGAGPSGIIHTTLSRNFGASQIIVSDLVNYRLEAAERFGADLTIDQRSESLVKKVKEVTNGIGADIVVVTAPNTKAFSEGIDTCRRGGTVCLFAPTSPKEYIRISQHRLFFSEIKIIPSYSTSHIETRAALKLMSTGRIKTKEIVTHRFPLNCAKEAFKTARSKECLKVVVQSK